jgi:hypothetical protein
MLREVTGGEVNCMRRQESVRGREEASRAGRRVMFSGCWGQRRVRKGFMIMGVPVCWTEVAGSSSDAPLAVGSKYRMVPPWRASRSCSIARAPRWLELYGWRAGGVLPPGRR